MSNKGILKSSLAKKYWMALTGLFLCIFLIGHLAGNLLLFTGGYEGRLAFNEYSVFMTTNPFVMLLSYLTYASILFHAIDGVVITINNRKARPQGYVYNKPQRNSIWSSRNMGLLGTLVLAFIVFHMWDFWYRFKFGEMPAMESEDGGSYLLKTGEKVAKGTVENDMVINTAGETVGPVMRDLHTEVVTAFQQEWVVIAYIIGLIALALHLYHGVQSAFHSMGWKTPVTRRPIYFWGKVFAIVITVGFAAIPIYVYFTH